MNILVCVKQVPSSNEVRLDPVTGVMIREGIHSCLNPFDAFAVEEALRLKEKYGGNITSLSMGISSASETLRDVKSLGADRCILLSDKLFAGSDTLATANALSKAISVIGIPDIILCGKAASDGDTSQTGIMISEFLGIPHAGDVAEIESISSDINASDKKMLRARRLTDDGYQRISLHLPAVVSVLKEINIPRLPSISGVLRGHRAQIEVMTAGDIGADPYEVGLKGSATKVIRTFVPKPRESCVMFDDVDSFIKSVLGGDIDA